MKKILSCCFVKNSFLSRSPFVSSFPSSSFDFPDVFQKRAFHSKPFNLFEKVSSSSSSLRNLKLNFGNFDSCKIFAKQHKKHFSSIFGGLVLCLVVLYILRRRKKKRLRNEKILNTILSLKRGLVLSLDEKTDIDSDLFSGCSKYSKKNRRRFRDVVVTTPKIETFVSGIILTRECIHQKTGGVPFWKELQHRGIQVGYSADRGHASTVVSSFDDDNEADEDDTQDLDGFEKKPLREYLPIGGSRRSFKKTIRLAKKQGVDFLTWRCSFDVDELGRVPRGDNLAANASLAEDFCLCCLKNGIAPVVECDVRCFERGMRVSIENTLFSTTRSLSFILDELERSGIDLQQVIVRTNLIACKKCEYEPEMVSEFTMDAFKGAIPKDIPLILCSTKSSSDPIKENYLDLFSRNVEYLTNASVFNFNKGKDFPWELSYVCGKDLLYRKMMTIDDKEQQQTQLLDDLRKMFIARYQCKEEL